MKNRLEYILFISFSFFFRIIGLYLSRRFAVVIAIIFYFLIPIRKEVTIDNLTNAFSELNKKQIRKIAFGAYRSFAITLVEILFTPSISKKQMIDEVKCSNVKLISQKFKEGNGVILLSAHFGNWEYIANSIALQSDKKFTVIVKPLRNNLVSDWMNKMRTKWNNDVVFLGVSIRQIYNVLREKNIVALVADQRGPEDSIKLDFFGRKTSVLVGPAALALKTGAPIIYGISIRQKDYSYKVDLVEISTDNLPDDNNDKIEELSKRHLKYLESVIKQYPEQWLWMHNRWKH
ncbi:MAG: lysophospholipid acyltransferase family protein [Ignavibacteriaceae bacterium]|nr:lysophospholipid acyltransferase family protein [Ignavibacteriaceae bacterium]